MKAARMHKIGDFRVDVLDNPGIQDEQLLMKVGANGSDERKNEKNMEETIFRKKLDIVPLSLVIDDCAPRVHVYYEHATKRITADGRPLVDEIPNSFLLDFCNVMEAYGIRGKFSIVPMPGGRGDIIDILNNDGFPILLTHWQSLFSNGLSTGLRVLEEVAKRVNSTLPGRVEWMTYEEIMNLVF